MTKIEEVYVVNITVIGSGYVGLTLGIGLSDFGWNVTCVDIDEERIKKLNNGIIPIFEEGLNEIVKRNLSERRLHFSTNLKEAVRGSSVIFIAVGTPSRDDGFTDLTQVWKVTDDLGKLIDEYKVIVVKSTVPIGTTGKIYNRIRELTNTDFDIVFNPEFLREGNAIHDFFHPDRVVIGTESEKSLDVMKEIYRPIYLLQTPFVFTNIETAEMIKYAANSFLAMKITFINEIANLCEKVGADVHDVARALGMDGRIGPKFLHAGPGYGGSCFPKDTNAFSYSAREFGSPLSLVEATIKANDKQKLFMVDKIRRMAGGSLKGKNIGILGLAFKQNTDDMRDSPAITIINKLLNEGAVVKAYDPEAMKNARKIFGERIILCKNEYDAAKDADLLVILTEWNQFRALDLDKLRLLMKTHAIADLRNVLEPMVVKEKGFTYEGVGRKI